MDRRPVTGQRRGVLGKAECSFAQCFKVKQFDQLFDKPHDLSMTSVAAHFQRTKAHRVGKKDADRRWCRVDGWFTFVAGACASGFTSLSRSAVCGLHTRPSAGFFLGEMFSVVLGQHQTGAATVSFGDDPHLAVTDLVAAEDAVAVGQCVFVGLDVVLLQITPVTADVSAQQSQRIDLVPFAVFKCCGGGYDRAQIEECHDASAVVSVLQSYEVAPVRTTSFWRRGRSVVGLVPRSKKIVGGRQNPVDLDAGLVAKCGFQHRRTRP